MGNSFSNSHGLDKPPLNDQTYEQTSEHSNHSQQKSKNVPNYLKPLSKGDRKVTKILKAHNDKALVQSQVKGEREKRKKTSVVPITPTTYSHQQHNNITEDGKYIWIHGRRFYYFDAIELLLPSDNPELERSRMQSYIFNWAFSGNLLVPLEESLSKGVKVLDVGCGTGAWIVDMALTFPNSTYVGVDMCDIFLADLELPVAAQQKKNISNLPVYLPKISIRSPVEERSHKKTSGTENDQSHSSVSSKVPSIPRVIFDKSNVVFEINDILKGLQYPDDTFTFVHMRQMTLSIPGDQWEHVMSELVRVTSPGGYVQLVEVDLILLMKDHPGIIRKVLHAILKRGYNLNISSKLNRLLEWSGLESIESRYVSIPIGSWGLEIGTLWQQNVLALIDSLKPRLISDLKCSDEAWSNAWRDAIKIMTEEKVFSNIHACWGRKPVGKPVKRNTPLPDLSDLSALPEDCHSLFLTEDINTWDTLNHSYDFEHCNSVTDSNTPRDRNITSSSGVVTASNVTRSF
ncbi:S-adenosyl-L-methionine-dependent methyltransferase [Spinellus fusiger]|nr:S-adenosyl-L-methionine-dependent methyltransferase [Spinellus fusiger]